jgi:hypothetical protein
VKELAFSSCTVLSRWIFSRNWRNSNPFLSSRDRLEWDPANSGKRNGVERGKLKNEGLRKEKEKKKGERNEKEK